MEISKILSDYIVKNVDPYFCQGLRKDLRYVAKDYNNAALMEINPNGIDPIDYFYYAKADLLSCDSRGAINAVGNIKRSIHLLVDSFLEILGLRKIYWKYNFPSKLEIIDKIEAFPTRLLRNLNSKRNYVEHDHANIKLDEAVELVEIGEIFLKLCYPYLKYTMVGTRVGKINSDKDIEWLLNPKTSTITINECTGSPYVETKHGVIYYQFHGNEDKICVNFIEMNKDNIKEWLPFLNTFMYCTQKRSLANSNPPYNPNDYERIMMFSSTKTYL